MSLAEIDALLKEVARLVEPDEFARSQPYFDTLRMKLNEMTVSDKLTQYRREFADLEKEYGKVKDTVSKDYLALNANIEKLADLLDLRSENPQRTIQRTIQLLNESLVKLQEDVNGLTSNRYKNFYSEKIKTAVKYIGLIKGQLPLSREIKPEPSTAPIRPPVTPQPSPAEAPESPSPTPFFKK